jgi:hypothetical protein
MVVKNSDNAEHNISLTVTFDMSLFLKYVILVLWNNEISNIVINMLS